MLLRQDVKAAGAGGPTRDFPTPIINHFYERLKTRDRQQKG